MRALLTILLGAITLSHTPARADFQPEEWKELGDRMKPQVEPGRKAAKPRAPQWCSDAKSETGFSPGALTRMLDSDRLNTETLLKAASITCLWPNQPAVHKAVQVIEQTWINWTNLSIDEALATFRARLSSRYKSDKTSLCKALEISSEISGEERAFAGARRNLFGCTDDDALWTNTTNVDESVAAYLDATVSPDELVRLAWLTARTRAFLGEHDAYFDKKLLAYVHDQLDLQIFDERQAMSLLDAAPYKGNSFARAVVIESIGNLKAAKAALQTEIDAKAKDADWKELLITAPQRGIANWNKQAAPYKEQLARSAAFEKKFFAASKKEARGCWSTLLADVATVVKPLDHGDPAKLEIALSQPIPSLLFSRLAACASLDQDGAWSSVLVTAASRLRLARGPRMAAYYEAFDALGKIKADRSNFPFEQGDLRQPKKHELLDEAQTIATKAMGNSKIDVMGFVGDDGESVVQSVKKTEGGVAVTFVTKKHQQMLTECTPTNRLLKIEADGKLVYEHVCRDKGLVWVDDTVGGIVVPEAMAAQIKPGTIVKFQAARGKAPDRTALPLEVYSEKSKKSLVTWKGLSL